MQNTINQLPIELTLPAAQPRQAVDSGIEGKAGFSEAMGSATDKASQTQADKTQNTKDQAEKVQEPNTPESTDKTTKEETKPVEETTEEEPKAVLPEVMDTSGFVNIHQTIAGMVIQITNEREAMEIIGLDSVPGMEETDSQTVDVLEGLQMQDNEEGIVTVSDEKPEQPGMEAQAEPVETKAEDDTRAWMPEQSSEAEAPAMPEAPKRQEPIQAVDVEREIESRLEEHLRPLENLNGSEELVTTEEIQTGFEIEVTQTKDENINKLDDIEASEPSTDKPEATDKPKATDRPEAADMPEATDKPITATRQTDTETGDDSQANDSERKQAVEEKPKAELPRQNEIGGVKQDVQPQAVRPVAERVEETVFSKMVENISTNAQQGNREFSINLRPDFMGDMNIQLVMTAEGLSARIKTDDPQASSIISQHLFKLEQSLKEQGIDIVNLEVSVFDTGDMTKEDFSKQGDQSNEANTRGRRIGRVSATATQAVAAAGLETLTESQTVEPTGLNSSVEYIA